MARLILLLLVCAAVGANAYPRSLLELVECKTGVNTPKAIDCPGGVVCNDDDCAGDVCEAKCTDGTTITLTKGPNGLVTFSPTDGTYGDIYIKGGNGYCKYSGSTDNVYTPDNCGPNRCGLSNTILCYKPCVCKDKLENAIKAGVKFTPTPTGYTVCTPPKATVTVCGKEIEGFSYTPKCGEKIKYKFTCPDGYYKDYESPYTIGETVEIVKDSCPPTATSTCVKDIVVTVGTPTYAPDYCKFSAPLTIKGSLCPVKKDYIISCDRKVTEKPKLV